MSKHTFTIYTENNEIEGYLFDVTRLEAQVVVTKMNEETEVKYYYVEGYEE